MHVHKVFHSLPPAVAALIKEQAMQAERPTSVQLDAIMAQVQQNADYIKALQSGMPPLNVKDIDYVLGRAQKAKLGDSDRRGDDRDAKRAELREDGFVDWVIEELSENFDSNRQAMQNVGVGIAHIDEQFQELSKPGVLLDLRLAYQPRINELMQSMAARLTALHHEAA